MYSGFSSPASIGLTANGLHGSEHLACFLCWADDPAVTHASLRVVGFSSDVTVRSKAAGFPRSLEHLLTVS